MATKTTGVEFKRFYSDIKYWPEKGDTYHEDVAYKVNGQDLPDDQDPGNVADGDEVTIEGGIVMNSPLYKEGSEPSVEAYFKRWKKEQTTTTFVVECDLTKIESIQAAINAAGGRIVK